jgi:hypothetical protein
MMFRLLNINLEGFFSYLMFMFVYKCKHKIRHSSTVSYMYYVIP